MKAAVQAVYKSEFFDQHMPLINTCRNKQYEANSTQIRHITPGSLSGDDSPDNLVELLLSDYVKAHELLFRHFVFCLQAAARSWASMVGKTGFFGENMIRKNVIFFWVSTRRRVYSAK